MTREERREYLRQWHKAHPEKNREYKERYYINHKDKHIACQKAWAKRNPDKVRAVQDRWRRDNRKRVNEIQAKSRANKSDARRLLDRALSRVHGFGLTLNQYLDLLLNQNFRCAICKQPATAGHGSRRSLDGFVVDHNHDTGRVRGLLHPNCNAAIGLLQDSFEMLRRAAEYLENQENGDL